MKKIEKNVVFLIVVFLFVACGSGKNITTEKSTKKNKNNVSLHSKANFPYIEAFHQAQRLKIRGNDDAAIEAFNRCLEMREDDDAVYYALAQLYIKKENIPQSLQMITKAYRLDPNNIWYAEELAIAYYDTQQFEKAIPIFKKLVDHESKNMSWLYGYGDCLLQTGKINEAISVLNKAEGVMGKHPSLSLEKYTLYLSIKKEKEALYELNEALLEFPKEPQIIATLVDHYFKKGDINKGIEFLTQLVEADPHNGRAHLTLGEINRQHGHIFEAFKEYKAAFACPDVDVDTKLNLLMTLQDTPHATDPQTMDLIEMMIAAHPNNAKSYTVKGDYLMNLEDETNALKNYRKALEFEVSVYAIWNQVLLIEYQNAFWDKLYEDSKRCLEYFSNIPMVYLMNGVSAIQLEKSIEAIDVLKTGRVLVVNDKKLEAEFLSQIGEAYLQMQNIAEGKKYYLQAIDKDSESNVIKNNFAYHLANTKNPLTEDLEIAIKYINIAVNRSPNQYHYYDTRGWVLFKQGKYQEALIDIEKALELSPNQPVVVEHLGDIYFKLNQVDNAIDCWKKAVKLGMQSELLNKKIESKIYIEQ